MLSSLFSILQASAATAEVNAIAILVSLALLAGSIKCFSMMVRPKASALCMLSLALLLLAMSSSGVTNVISNSVENIPQLKTAIAVGLGAINGLLMISALILAVVGLSLYKPKEKKYETGKGQAITVISLVSVFLLIGIFAAVSASTAAGKIGETSGAPVEDDLLNYTVELPSARWAELDPKQHNEAATIIYRRVYPEIWFMLIAERPGLSAEITTGALTEISKTNLTSQEGDFNVTDLPSREINGMNFSIFETEARGIAGTSTSLSYRHYVTSHQGYCYQLVFFSGLGDREKLNEAADTIAGSFAQLRPDDPLISPSGAVEPFERKDVGVSVDLTSLGWGNYDDTAGDFPEAVFAASAGGVKSTGVTYLNLDGLDADLDALRGGFLSAGFGTDEDQTFDGRREIAQGGASGEAFHFSQSSEEGSFIYHFRLLRQEDHVWFISAWSNADFPNASEKLEEILDKYQISTPDGSFDLSEEPEDFTKALSEIFNETGLAYYRRSDYQSGQRYFERASLLNPEKGLFFENIIHALTMTNQPEQAIELLEERQSKFSSNTNLGVMKGASFASLNRTAEAIEAYDEAFTAGHSDADELLDYLNVLVDEEKQERGIEVIEAFDKKHPGNSFRLTRWKSSLLQQLDRHDEAIELLEELADKQPDYRLKIDIIDALLDGDRYSDAIASVNEMIDAGTRNSEVLFLKGRAELGLESYRDAKSDFEAALKLSPDDENIAEYLEHASTMLGKGSVAEIQNEIEPLDLPEEIVQLANRFQEQNEADLDDSYGCAVLKQISGRFFEKGKPEKSTFQSSIKIIDSKGLDRFSTLKFGFDPHVEQLFINEVKVTDEEGNTIATADSEDFFIVDDTDDELATTEKNVHVPVPGLKIGQTLHYTVTREYFGNSTEIEYIDRPMNSSIPSVGNIYYVLCDPETVTTSITEGVEELKIENGIAFYVNHPKPRQSESMQPWLQSFNPWIRLSTSDVTWEGEGLEYLDRLDSLLNDAPTDITELAERLTSGVSEPSEKIALLSDHVSSTLTYQGIEFGPRGRIPNSSMKILENRYGDCKDHSLLLVQLLTAVDVDAYLALVSTGSPVEPEMPSLDQFDHMIVYAPSAKSPFIDPTADHFPHGRLAPEALVHEQGLVLDPENVRLEKVEANEGAGNRFKSDRQVRLDSADKSVILVDETITLAGYPANWYRDYLENLRNSERIEKLTALLRTYGEPLLESFEIEALDDLDSPLVMKMSYRMKRPLSQRRSRQSIDVPSVWEDYFLKLSPDLDRKNPFEIMIDSEFVSHCTIAAPSEWSIDAEALEHFNLKSDDQFATWKITSEVDADFKTLEIHSSFYRKSGTHPAETHSDFIKSVNHGIDVLQQELSFSVPEG